MDSFLKKTGNLYLPRTSSTLSICSLPRTNSTSSLPRKGSLEDILNYSNFLDETSAEQSNNQSTELISNEASNLGLPRNFSYSSFLVDNISKSFSQEEDKIFASNDEEKETKFNSVPSPTNLEVTEQQQEQPSVQHFEEPSDEGLHYEDEPSVENIDQVRTLEEALRETTSEPQKVSYGSYGEFTVIDGVMYNNKGYEICGHMNQHNRPCQRIGKCPFHVKKERKEIQRHDSISSDASMEEKKSHPQVPRQPMKKTPYKQGWTKEEHFRFLTGLEIHGKGAWKDIAVIVGTRTPTQIQSHAQKYFLRQKQKVKNKRSIHDFTLEDLKKSLNQNVILASKNNSAANSPVPSGEDSSVESAPKKKEKAKRKKKSKKQVKSESPATPITNDADEQSLLQQPLFLAAQQQAGTNMNPLYNTMNAFANPEFAKNLASFVSAMQNPAFSSAIPLSSYSMLGSMLVNPAFAAVAPAFLAQQQLLMQHQQAPMMAEPMEEEPSSNKEGILEDAAFDSFPGYGFDSFPNTSPIASHKRKLHETTFADDIFSPEKKKHHKL